MKRSHSILALSLCFFTANAIADEVLFKNGDRLLGKITGGGDGKLVMSSVSAGTVTINLADVKTISSDEPITIVFKDGTSITQKVSSVMEDGRFAINQGVVQPQSFSLMDIGKINPPPVKWTGSLSAGLTITRGNTRSSNASIDLNAVRKGEVDRITFNAGYSSSRQEDSTGNESTTKRMEYGALQYDYFFSKTTYGYVNARAEKDAIALLDLRLTSGAGVGFQILDRGDINASGELGVSWLSENYAGATPSNDTATGRAAFRLNKTFETGVKFFSDGEWYESFEDFEDQYARATVGLRSALTKSMFAEAKAVWMWDATPAIGKVRQDVSYILGVGWSF